MYFKGASVTCSWHQGYFVSWHQNVNIPYGRYVAHTVGRCGIVLYNPSSLLYFTGNNSYLLIWIGVSSGVWIYWSFVCYGHGGELLIGQTLELSFFFLNPLDFPLSSAEGMRGINVPITKQLVSSGVSPFLFL
jgi:hypothetical protein